MSMVSIFTKTFHVWRNGTKENGFEYCLHTIAEQLISFNTGLQKTK